MPPNVANRMSRLLRRPQELALHDEEGNEYWYRPGELLVRNEGVARFRRDFASVAEVLDDTGVEGLAYRRLRLRQGRRLPEGLQRIPQLVRHLDERGLSEDVAPNHVFGAAPETAFGPATAARATTDTLPPLIPPADADPDCVVGVLDSGVRLVAHPLAAEHGELALDPRVDEDRLDQKPVDGLLDDADVHGSFIADLIRLLAPGAGVRVGRVLLGGIADEVEIAQGIERMRAAGVQVLNLSLYGYTDRDREPVILRRALDRLPASTAVVAAAGNNGLERRTWPAASERVIGVGAVDMRHGSPRPAEFSNRGPWVDACADGVDVLSSYVDLQEAGDGGQHFTGTARWSGTSFAAPRVAAAIMRRVMEQGGGDAEGAARQMLAEPGRTKVGGLGVLVP